MRSPIDPNQVGFSDRTEHVESQSLSEDTFRASISVDGSCVQEGFSRPQNQELGLRSSTPIVNSDWSALPPFDHYRPLCRSIHSDNVYVNSFRFNQDGSCFAASTTEGFRVFTCSPLSEFARREIGNPVGAEIDIHGDGRVNIIAMLYRSHSFAFVTHKEPKRVQLWNDREGKIVGTIRCRHCIRNIFLSREIITVVTENAVYIYLAVTISPIHVLATGYNPLGVCSVSSDANAPWTLACPTITPGAVRIQTAEAGETQGGGIVFQAHQNPLGCIALNPSGTMVGTASILGTVIKIFKTSDGDRLYELRLASVPHEIRGIVIRGDNQFVAVTSNSLKVHIFKLDVDKSSALFGKDSNNEALESAITSRYSNRSNADSSISPPSYVPNSNGLFPSDWEQIQYHHAQPFTSSASSTSTSLRGSALGSLTSAFMSQSKDLVAGTLKTVLPKYFASIRSFAQLALPVDSELDVRSCNPIAISQHRAQPCEDCRTVLRMQRTSPLGLNMPPLLVGRLRSSSSSGAARLVEGFGRTSSFLSGGRHFAADDNQQIQLNVCLCGFGSSWSSGPLCAFAGDRSNHFYILHHDGFFYEARFDSQHGGPCQVLSVSPWFAPRRDFSLQGTLASVEAPASSELPTLQRLSFSSSDDGPNSKNARPILNLSELNLSDIEIADQEKVVLTSCQMQTLSEQHEPLCQSSKKPLDEKVPLRTKELVVEVPLNNYLYFSPNDSDISLNIEMNELEMKCSDNKKASYRSSEKMVLLSGVEKNIEAPVLDLSNVQSKNWATTNSEQLILSLSAAKLNFSKEETSGYEESGEKKRQFGENVNDVACFLDSVASDGDLNSNVKPANTFELNRDTASSFCLTADCASGTSVGDNEKEGYNNNKDKAFSYHFSFQSDASELIQISSDLASNDYFDPITTEPSASSESVLYEKSTGESVGQTPGNFTVTANGSLIATYKFKKTNPFSKSNRVKEKSNKNPKPELSLSLTSDPAYGFEEQPAFVTLPILSERLPMETPSNSCHAISNQEQTRLASRSLVNAKYVSPMAGQTSGSQLHTGETEPRTTTQLCVTENTYLLNFIQDTEESLSCQSQSHSTSNYQTPKIENSEFQTGRKTPLSSEHSNLSCNTYCNNHESNQYIEYWDGYPSSGVCIIGSPNSKCISSDELGRGCCNLNDVNGVSAVSEPNGVVNSIAVAEGEICSHQEENKTPAALNLADPSTCSIGSLPFGSDNHALTSSPFIGLPESSKSLLLTKSTNDGRIDVARRCRKRQR